MLPKINRLAKEREINTVFKKGKVFKSDFLLVRLMKNNLQKSRFSFVVGKKVSNKAVQRNKIKRRLRQIVLNELRKNQMPEYKESVDGVVIALPGIEKKQFSEIQEAVTSLFKKL